MFFHITPREITVRNKKELRKTLNGLKKKYPDLDVEKCIENAETKKKYLNERYHFSIQITNRLILQSVCKTAVNFYIIV